MVYVNFDDNGKFTGLIADEETLRELDLEENEKIKNILKKLKKKNRIARQIKAGFCFPETFTYNSAYAQRKKISISCQGCNLPTS